MTDSQQDMQKQEAGATAPDGNAPKKVNVALRVYGVLMMLMGILDMVVFLFIGALLGLAPYFSTMSPELAGMFNAPLAEALGDQTTLAMALVALSVRIDPHARRRAQGRPAGPSHMERPLACK